MFKTRLLSGIVLIALALFFLIAGGNFLWAVTVAISLIGLFELYRIFHMEKSMAGAVGYVLLCIYLPQI